MFLREDPLEMQLAASRSGYGLCVLISSVVSLKYVKNVISNEVRNPTFPEALKKDNIGQFFRSTATTGCLTRLSSPLRNRCDITFSFDDQGAIPYSSHLVWRPDALDL